MGINGNTWLYMVIHGNTWVYMGIHCNTWVYMVIEGYTWVYNAIHGNKWLYMALHGLYMAIHGNTWLFVYISWYTLITLLKVPTKNGAAILESEKTLGTRLTSVLTVLARISKRGYQNRFIRSITTRTEMTCIGWTENKNKNKTYSSLHRFVIFLCDEVFIQ